MRVIFCYNWYVREQDGKIRLASPPTDWDKDRIISDLTIGKEYSVYNSNIKGRYFIANDYGVIDDYPKNLFTTLEEVREHKLKEIGI